MAFSLSGLMRALTESEAFPELYAERERSVEEEERNSRLDTPLFVCQLSFPGVPTNLHFFEPRYLKKKLFLLTVHLMASNN